jgi:ribonuclease HI
MQLIFNSGDQNNIHVFLFVDGASKRNPGVAGVRDILINLGGKNERSYAWGLGKLSNNQEKYYSLLQELRLAMETKIQHLIVLGDSSVIVLWMIKKLFLDDHRIFRFNPNWSSIQGLKNSRCFLLSCPKNHNRQTNIMTNKEITLKMAIQGLKNSRCFLLSCPKNHNRQTNIMTNKEITLKMEELRVNGALTTQDIP